ncbi:AIR synthase related protein [Halovulum sp. GXIMD14794]
MPSTVRTRVQCPGPNSKYVATRSVRPPDPAALSSSLQCHPAISSKLAAAKVVEALGLAPGAAGYPGDDAAILPRWEGADLLSCQGIAPALTAHDPWLAGWCGVVANLSSIAAMGGRTAALVNQVSTPSIAAAAPMIDGMAAAARAYDVPLVGGHTDCSGRDLSFSVSALGYVDTPVKCSAARPGHVLMAVADHRGDLRDFDRFCSGLGAPAKRMREDLELLPRLAEDGMLKACRGIGQAGLGGAAIAMADCSDVGAVLDLEHIAPPEGIPLQQWLRTWPSYGFLLSTAPELTEAVRNEFVARNIRCDAIGEVIEGPAVLFRSGGDCVPFWNHAERPYIGLSRKRPGVPAAFDGAVSP